MTLEERLKAAKGTRRKNDKAEVERKRQEFEQSKKTLPMLQTAKSGTSDKDSGGPRRTASTTTTTALPMKSGGKKQSGTDTAAANVSSWLKEDKAKGSAQGIHDRMAQMLSGGSSATPSQRKREQDRKSARRELSSLLSQTVTEEDRNDLTARIRAAQQTLNETKPKGKTRGNAESFALSAENLGSQLVRGVEAPLAAVSSVGYQALHDLTSLGGQAENPVSRWAERSAAGVQTLPISSTWQRSIQERYRPNETEQTVMDVTGNIASMLPSLALSAGIGAAAGAGQGAAALTAADTAAKGQRAGQLMMALQGMGSAAKEARDEGATTAQANLYGAADGLLGAATERISGGIPLLGSGVADKALANVKSPLVRVAADMAGEGFEEGLQTAAEPYLKRAIYDPNARNATPSEIGQSAAMGALASGALKLGIEAPQAVESGLQRFRAERPGRELTAQLRSASAQMDRDAQTARTRSLERLDPIGDVSGMGLTSDTGRRTMRAGDGLLPPRAFGEVDYDTAPEGAGRRTPGQYSADEIRASERGKDYRAQADADVPAMAERMAKAGKGRIDQGRMFQELRRYSGEDPERIVAAVESFRDLSKQAPYETAEDGSIWRHDLTRGVNGQLPDPNAPLSQDITVDRKSNAYSFDHPELRPYIVQAADGMKADLANTIRGERTYWYDRDAAAGENPNVWGGIKRQTAPDIAAMLDGDAYGAKMSYKTIDDGLDDILADHGKENSLRAKRVEAMLVDRLQNGYRDAEGRPMPSDDTFGLEWDALQSEQERGAADTRTQQLREKLADTRSQDASEPPYPELDFGDTDWRDADIQETGILPASERERLEAAQRRADMGQYQRGNTVDGTASRAYDGRIDRKEDVSYDQRGSHPTVAGGSETRENAGGAGLAGEVRTGGPVETGPVRGRYGGRRENASYDQRPVRDWVEGHTVEPQEGSVSHAEQRAAMEYGIPSFVVDDAAWDANEKHRNGFSTDGQIYIRSSIPEQARGMVTSHEANHVMRQIGYEPYLDFVERTPGMLNFGTRENQVLLEHVAKHAGIDINSMTPADATRLYDELNASVYGHIASGKMDGIGEGLRNAFRDFDAYASELSDIHRRFKEERGGGAGYGASQSPQTERPVGPESSVGAAEKGFDPWSAFQGTKSQFYPEGPNAARPVDVPTTDADGDPVRKSASTIMGARAVTDETAGMVQDMVRQGRFSYEKNGDAGSVQRARSTIQEKGFQRSMEQYADVVRRGVVSKDMVTLGQQLLVDASNAGDVKATAELLTLYGTSSTSAAQAMQAQAILRKLTPEGQLYAIQRTVQELNKSVQPTLEKRAAREAKKAEKKAKRAERMGKLLPGADGGVEQGVEQDALEQIRGKAERATGVENITISQELVEKFLKADGQEARDAVMEEIYQHVADQVPSTWQDKFRAWRYLSMLAAPRTHGRNFIGNVGGQGMRIGKDLIASGLEAAVDKISGGKLQRTKTYFASPELYKLAEADFKNVSEAMGGTKYDDVKGQIQDRRTIFKKGLPTKATEKAVQTVSGNKDFSFRHGAMETVRRFNSDALSGEDTFFKRKTYADALARFLSANKVTAEQMRNGTVDADLLARGRDYAAREAMRATFNDKNDFSDMVSSIGRGMMDSDNKFTRAAGKLVEGVLPFKRTPANILVRSAEYSPAGLLKSLTADLVKVKQGKMSGAEAIDNISAGAAGTLLMAFGALLASRGLLTGGGSGDENEDKLDDLTGGQDYALEVGGHSYTLDWFAPASLPMFMGVELYNAIDESDMGASEAQTALNALINLGGVTLKSAEPMLELSMLQSLNDLLTNKSYSDDGSPLYTLVASSLSSYLTQGIPTIWGQLMRTMTDKRYTTYTDKNKLLPDLQYAVGKQSSRLLPGAAGYQQIPYIDAWGREEKNRTLPWRAFDNFLSPGYYSKKNETAVDKEIRRLYRATGTASVVPDRFDKSVTIDGKKVWLDKDQYVKGAKAAGQAKFDTLEKLIGTDAYRNADDSRKAELVQDIMEYGNAVGRMAATDWKPGESSWLNKAVAAVKDGVDIVDYVSYNESKDADGDGTVSQSEAARALLPMKDLSDEQKSTLWKSANSSWSEKKDPFLGTLPTKAKLTPEKSVELMEEYRAIDRADYTGDKVASQKQTAWSKYLDKAGLSKDQRTVVDDTYKFWSMMPAKVQAYSVDTMSEAAQKHWPALKALDMSEAAYLQVYPIVAKTEKGYTKADKIRDLMALGYSRSQANTIYSKIQSK